jgi:hypothetical protein
MRIQDFPEDRVAMCLLLFLVKFLKADELVTCCEASVIDPIEL